MIVYRQRRSLELSNIIQEMSTLSMKDYIIKNHELNKFKLLYLENAPRLIFYASKYVDSDTAEDLVHDIFIKIWQKKEIYSVEEGLKTYLFRSVQNACLDYLKHKSIEMTYADEVARRLKIEEIDYYNQSDAAELEKERLDSVYREIAKLPDRCREVFTLAYVDGKKSVEIAGMLNISQRTVEAQLYKGLKNVGEPGGGPFLAYNSDGTISLQILESSQIDMNDPQKKEMFEKGTHFNPVDLVCAVRDYKGHKFDLVKYVDKATGFISYKSKNGKELKALELPGLWNGAMSDWNTVFVEVPLSTFNPVKTVNDLLREQHQ